MARAAALAGDDQRAFVCEELDLLGVDPGQVDDDVERRGALGAVAVDLGPEPGVAPREAGHLPDLGEELLHLSAQPVDGVTGHAPMVPPLPFDALASRH